MSFIKRQNENFNNVRCKKLDKKYLRKSDDIKAVVTGDSP